MGKGGIAHNEQCLLFLQCFLSVWRSIEWCFTPLLTVFQSYHSHRSHYSCLSWVSPVLGWALKCLVQGHSHSVWKLFCHVHQIRNGRLQTLSVWKSLKFVICERVKGKQVTLNSLPNEKMLVTSIFFFSTMF